jgi:hypothetical protein
VVVRVSGSGLEEVVVAAVSIDKGCYGSWRLVDVACF